MPVDLDHECPLKITTSKKLKLHPEIDALFVPFWQTESGVAFASKIPGLTDLPIPPLALLDFSASAGEQLTLFPEKWGETRLILIGLGPEEEATLESLRQSMSTLIRCSKSKEIHRAHLVFPKHPRVPSKKWLRALLEGIFLSYYSLPNEGEGDRPLLHSLVLIGASNGVTSEVRRAAKISKGVYLARDLTNLSADIVTPEALASVARGISQRFETVKCRIYTEKELTKMGMGLVLAVSRGSKHQAHFVVAEYAPKKRPEKIPVFVGKGVTYDTGGLNLKSHMSHMRSDMGGAAACLGLLCAAAECKIKQNFAVVIPIVENAIGSESYKPGDVYKSYSGKTVEITNTDAEGRLILADALTYVSKKLQPDVVVDIATLTGAMVVALGHEVTGLMGTSEEAVKCMIKAGEATGERVARLPLIDELLDDLSSNVADLKNSGARDGSSIKAGLFLKEFVDELPWLHLDIAGTSFRSAGKGYLPKNATGVGVRLLLEFLQKYT